MAIEVKKPLPLETTEFKYVDTLVELTWLCEHLGKANRAHVTEIAVDLEHHSYRSFQGFTCLMQISTRTHDFIIDAIKLRTEMHRLNEIFTDWTLTKVRSSGPGSSLRPNHQICYILGSARS